MQILFAFLLTPAFTPRFPDLDSVQRTTYVVTPLLAVLAAALFTAPAARQRSLFGQNAKPVVVRVSSRPTGTGLAVLTPAFAGSVPLIVDVTLDRAAGILAGTGTPVVCLFLWGVLPKPVGRSDRDDGPSAPRQDEGSVRAPEDRLP